MKLFYSKDIGELSKALAAAQTEMGRAAKDSTNPHFKSKYADLNSCLDAVLPALNKHGIALTQFPGNDDERISLVTMLTHSSGQYMGSEATMKAERAGPHAHGSALTYLRRYSVAAVCGLMQEDDDGNTAQAATSKPTAAKSISESQAAQLQDMIDATGTDMAKFLGYMQVDKIAAMSSGDFAKAMTMLKAKQGKVA